MDTQRGRASAGEMRQATQETIKTNKTRRPKSGRNKKYPEPGARWIRNEVVLPRGRCDRQHKKQSKQTKQGQDAQSPPRRTKHGTKYVTFELLLIMHTAFVADEIQGFTLKPARRKKHNFASHQVCGKPRAWYVVIPRILR